MTRGGVAMRRDRYGEPIDPEDLDEQPVHPYRCRRSGWIDRDADHPIPCLVCKPHLARTDQQAQLVVGERDG